MDITVLHLAVPSLTADLAPSSGQLLWIVDIYGFFIAGSLITMGTLGDRVGRRRVLLIGGAAFAAASALAAFSTTAEMLIVSRAVLGVAGATLMPSTISLLSVMFPDPKQRAFAIGVWIACFSIGGVLGPVLGGMMLEYFWWGSVFLLALPVMALLLVVGPVLLPEYRDPRAERLDIISAALSLFAVLAVIYGIKHAAVHGAGWQPALYITGGAALGLAFVRRQRFLADPLIDLGLFRSAAFNAAITANVATVFAFFGIWLFLAQYLQLVLDLSPLEAGLWQLPSNLAVIVGSMVGPVLVRTQRRAHVVAGSLVIAAFGVAILSQLDQGSGLWAVLIGTSIATLGMAPVFSLGTDLILSAAPPERAGAASAISETSGELGGALGLAVLGSLGTAVYRWRIAEVMLANVPAEAAATAIDTLGGAMFVAQALGEPAGTLIVDAARAAFVGGLQVTGVASALILAATAVVVLIVLREPRHRGHNSAAGD